MSQQTYSYSEQHSRERLQRIDTLKAPVVQMGRNLGYKVISRSEDGDNQKTEDNQLSLRKIELTAFHEIRSDLDNVNLVSEMMICQSLSVARSIG